MTSTFRDWYGEPPARITGQLTLKAGKAQPKPLTIKEVVARQLHTTRRTNDTKPAPDRR